MADGPNDLRLRNVPTDPNPNDIRLGRESTVIVDMAAALTDIDLLIGTLSGHASTVVFELHGSVGRERARRRRRLS